MSKSKLFKDNGNFFKNGNPSGFRVGDWVEVRSREEILKTLDKNGQLEGLPFMPEMFAFCGQRLRVYKRAHKTCDTVYEYRGRRMKDAVHLEGVRCNGQSHGGCEASCLIFWKTAWLRKLDGEGVAAHLSATLSPCSVRNNGLHHCTAADVCAGTRKPRTGDGADEDQPSYVCQATQLPAATEPLPWWQPAQYVEDYTSGNVGLARIAKSFAYRSFRRCLVNLGIGIGPPLQWLYNMFQRLRGGVPWPEDGKLPPGARTPTVRLDLQPGEWVRVKDRDAILATCESLKTTNRGMTFDPEMVPYCGGTYRVLRRVSKIINEKTGKMQEIKNPCIILDGVVCQARYSQCRLFCPRSIYPYWREIWLERVAPASDGAAPSGRSSAKDAPAAESNVVAISNSLLQIRNL
jgi:hypothetical protein